MIELNKVYCMDNLELLKQLKDESIDLIYCDILYNTGKKFKDYDDNLGTPQEAIEWYRPRLIEMKRVLKNTGSIFIHCDWHLNSYLRVFMDELFVYKMFRNEIIRINCNPKNNSNNYGRIYDNILNPRIRLPSVLIVLNYPCNKFHLVLFYHSLFHSSI